MKLIIGGCDTETTGLDPKDHRLIEVAIVRYVYDTDTHVVVPKGEFTWRIDPERSIDKKAQDVHGISSSDLIGKPKFRDVAKDIYACFKPCQVVIGHNFMEFDAPFLINEFERCHQPLPDFEPYDTMFQGRWATPMGAVPSLQALCFASGVPYDKSLAHGALYDITVNMECLWYGLRRGVFTLPAV